MRKIIDGKLYDTDTAKLIGCYANLNDATDTSYYSECLYKKRTGEYFIYGKGGPLTKYAESVGGNSWGSGEKIMPLNYNDAKQFAEEKLLSDFYENEFGLPDEEINSGNITLSVSVSPEASFLARKIANVKNITLSKFVEHAILEYYKSEYLNFNPEK